MATEIEVILPSLDETQSIEYGFQDGVDLDDEMTIVDALKNKNNSLFITVIATADGTLTIKAGDNYPNAMLGDLEVAIATGVNVIRLQDIARFENRDGSVVLTNDSAAGTIFAAAKRAGITPADEQ